MMGTVANRVGGCQQKSEPKPKILVDKPSLADYAPAVTLSDALKPYGIASGADLSKEFGVHRATASLYWSGRRPLPVDFAIRIKEFTKGALSLDYLLALNNGIEQRRKRGPKTKAKKR